MKETSIELLKSLTQADGIPGYETEVREIFRETVTGVGPIGTDRLGSIFCTRAGNAEHPRILAGFTFGRDRFCCAKRHG